MTRAELPPPIPHQAEVPAASSPEAELGLPAFLPPWAPALAVWPAIDETRYRLTSRCFGTGQEWDAFRSGALAAGLLEDDPGSGAYRFAARWEPVLQAALDPWGGVQVVRERLIACWLADREPALAPQVARWANALERWEVVEEAWLALNGYAKYFPPDVLRLYGDLPAEARRERPFLTWVSGAAASVLAPTPRRAAEVAVERLLHDCALLHADWATREDADAAVGAGTYRMLGQRRLPSNQPGQSLAAAWRTKQEVDALIDARSRDGHGASRRTQALFRVFSARLALARADPVGAFNEAHWAGVLADWEPVRLIAHGLEVLSSSILRESGPEPGGVRVEQIDDHLGPRGFRGMGEAYEVLAEAFRAVRALDRPALEHALSLVSSDDAAIAGVWAIRVSAQAFRDALWRDPQAGHTHLMAEIGRESLTGREQDEPLGGLLLARARLLLLTRAGAFGVAAELAEALPEPVRLVPMARMLVSAGRLEEAIGLADSAVYAEGLPVSDRPKLAMVRVAAALLQGTDDERRRAEVVRALRTHLAAENFLPIGTLPRSAREALLQAVAPELEDEPNLALLRERLAGLSDSGDAAVRPIRLTERERVLLPMLAGADPVPEIARKLHVSVNTVRKQVVTLREKFQAETRAELVRKARNHGALS